LINWIAIRQFNDERTLTFGEQSGEMNGARQNIDGAIRGCEAEVFAVVDIVQRMWEKPVHLSTAAAMTCLMRTLRGREIFLDKLRCGAAIAAANVTHRGRPS